MPPNMWSIEAQRWKCSGLICLHQVIHTRITPFSVQSLAREAGNEKSFVCPFTMAQPKISAVLIWNITADNRYQVGDVSA